MQIDIDALETYNSLAREGARSAAESLSQLTGLETHVEVTNVSLVSPADLDTGGDTRSGVRVELDGALEGEAVLTFKEDARQIIENVLAPEADQRMRRSSIEEVGNIMTSGFIDGWADHLDEIIDISPPTFLDGSEADPLPADSASTGEQLFVIRSRVEFPDEAADFRILLVPERDAFIEAVEPVDGDSIPFEKFEVFNEMTKSGAEKAATNVTTMTGIETAVEINRMSFVPIEEVPVSVGDQRYVGTVMEYEGTPSGYLAILFDRPSAEAVVDALVPVETDGEWSEMEQSAMKEIGNIMTSGFIDGWANVLETSIDHSPPRFVSDMGSSIMSPIVGQMARTQEHAFLLDSVIRTDDGVFRCELFALPHEDELREVLEELLVERADRTHVSPDEVF